MGNTFTNYTFANYNFDTNGKFVSGIARDGTEETSNIVGFYVSDFGQTSDYLYNPIVDSMALNTDLNVLFPHGFFLSGVEHYQKSNQGSTIAEEQIHYIITDGYSKRVGYIHYQQYLLGGNTPETIETIDQFSCGPGEYLTNQNNKSNNTDQVRTLIYDYKCSAGGPRPIPASNVGAMGPIGPRGWQGAPGSIGIQGTQGLHGKKGVTGIQGLIGLKGDRGLPGDQGLRGSPGVKGDTGPNGENGPQGIKGVAFDTKRVRQQLHLTTIILFLVVVYVIVYVSSFSTVLGTNKNTVGDTVTDSDELSDIMTDRSDDMVGSMVGGVIDSVVGGYIR
jgi:hypothetical protein